KPCREQDSRGVQADSGHEAPTAFDGALGKNLSTIHGVLLRDQGLPSTGGAILRSRAQRRQGGLVSHREPFAVRSAQVESGRKGIAMDVMIVRVLIALVGVAVVLVRAWEDGRGPRQRDRVQGSLGPLTHIADDKERADDRRRRHHPESGLSRAYLL